MACLPLCAHRSSHLPWGCNITRIHDRRSFDPPLEKPENVPLTSSSRRTAVDNASNCTKQHSYTKYLVFHLLFSHAVRPCARKHSARSSVPIVLLREASSSVIFATDDPVSTPSPLPSPLTTSLSPRSSASPLTNLFPRLRACQRSAITRAIPHISDILSSSSPLPVPASLSSTYSSQHRSGCVSISPPKDHCNRRSRYRQEADPIGPH